MASAAVKGGGSVVDLLRLPIFVGLFGLCFVMQYLLSFLVLKILR